MVEEKFSREHKEPIRHFKRMTFRSRTRAEVWKRVSTTAPDLLPRNPFNFSKTRVSAAEREEYTEYLRQVRNVRDDWPNHDIFTTAKA